MHTVHKINNNRSFINIKVHRVSVIWSSDIWSFWLYFGYMVNSQSDFSTKLFGYIVISTIWSTLSGQNRGPYIRNPVNRGNQMLTIRDSYPELLELPGESGEVELPDGPGEPVADVLLGPGLGVPRHL